MEITRKPENLKDQDQKEDYKYTPEEEYNYKE